jgi:hypothetical protein
MSGSNRKGSWFQTYTGAQFYPFDPRAEDIDIVDIAHHLSLVCRFNGACIEAYSVAHHSVLVSHVCPPEFAKWGLLHDAAEAYIGDMIRPLKQDMPLYKEVEIGIEKVVAEKFGLEFPIPPEVKEADNILLYTERRDLLLQRTQHKWTLSDVIVPLQMTIYPSYGLDAEEMFLERYVELFGEW